MKFHESVIRKVICCVIGENVAEFFFRVAALTFEDSILKDLERGITSTRIGGGDSISKIPISKQNGDGRVGGESIGPDRY